MTGTRGQASRALLIATMLASSARPAAAQSMRLFTAWRPVGAERALHVTLDFAGGNVTISSAATGELYHMAVRYDADRYLPVQQYEPRTGVLHLGLERVGGREIYAAVGPRPQQTGAFTFAPDIPLALDASLDASDATLDLGWYHADGARGPRCGHACHGGLFPPHARGLRVGHVHRWSGAARGAASRAGGVCHRPSGRRCTGGASLAFDGVWRRDLALIVDLAMGSLTLRIPRGTGVRISADQFLSLLDTGGLVRAGDSWVTPGYAAAAHKLTVELKTAMVGVDLKWIEP